MDKKDLVNVFDYEAAAREKLPKTAYDYYRSGANDEITLHDNHAAYERIQLKPKVLIDTSKRDLTTTVLGQTVSMRAGANRINAHTGCPHGFPPHGPSGG
jgi:isopentenyl diphosphate isomerase/L-lactate dehydrogenase-like FMN-dependent dehydrogenase